MSHANVAPFSASQLAGILLTTKNGFSANKNNVNQLGLVIGSATKVSFTNELYDYNDEYDAPNSRYTPKVAGLYLLNFGISFIATAALDNLKLLVFKNGVEFCAGGVTQAADALTIGGSWGVIADANGTTDYFEIFASLGALSGTRDISGNNVRTYFRATRLNTWVN